MQITREQFAELLGVDLPTPRDTSHPWKLGTCYIIRCVTNYSVGRLSFVGEQELVLDDASWVADTGRFCDCIKTGSLNEVEPYCGSVVIGRGAIVDAVEWTHKLPGEQK